MKIKILVVILLFCVGDINAGWRTIAWQKDRWYSTSGFIIKYDKVEHAMFFGGITLLSDNGWKYALALGLANEVKDALLPYEKYGWIGGEGFSYKDMLANCGGVLVGYVVKKYVIKRIFH